jgi:zinc transporter, ZIP family
MTYEKTLLLGAIAGFTIFLGLPLARVRNLGVRTRLAASMASAGVLAFLFFDVLAGSNEIVEGALAQAKDGDASWGRFAGLFAMLVIGFGVGLIGLGIVEKRILGGTPPPIAGGSDALVLADSPLAGLARPSISTGMRMGMLIAVAIGVHNFSEGLAIGVSAHAGEVALATTLIVGFALHNATEGFGIVGPLDGASRPSWGWLALVGIIGGGPTVLGTALGYQVTSEALQLGFLALAAGAILYITIELWGMSRRRGHRVLATSALAVGFLVAYASDLMVAYAGG